MQDTDATSRIGTIRSGFASVLRWTCRCGAQFVTPLALLSGAFLAGDLAAVFSIIRQRQQCGKGSPRGLPLDVRFFPSDAKRAVCDGPTTASRRGVQIGAHAVVRGSASVAHLGGSDTGTTFVVERDDKQYILAVRHVVAVAGDDIGPSRTLGQHTRQWTPVHVSAVASGHGETEVAVLSPTSSIAVVGAQPGLAGRLAYGRPTRFQGLPFGSAVGGEELTND